jgi:hypothetical protein
VLQLLVLALVAAGIVLTGCGGTAGDDGNASFTARLPAVSVAEKLATMDERAAHPLLPAHPALVVEFESQLLNLVFKCKEGRLSLEDRFSLLADYTVKAQKVLAKRGKNESLLSIISQLNGSIPYGAPRQSCSDVFDATVRNPRATVRDALSDEPQTANEIAEATELPVATVRRILGELIDERRALQEGAGKRGE